MVKFFIDPGHGGTDPGATANGLFEKYLSLAIALKIKSLLLNYENTQVKLSRETDVFIPLGERADMANGWGADYFMSIHINAGRGTGFETFVYTSASAASIAHQNVIHPEILNPSGLKDRGEKRANYQVLRQTNMPAILTENGFIDNASDAAKLKQDSYLDEIAQGHVNGLVKAFGLKKKEVKPVSKPTVQTKPAEAKKNQISVFQSWLNKNYNSGLVVDGKCGPKTRTAVIKALQTELNKQFNARLVVDGKWGPKTKAAVQSIRKGAKGNLVYILQGLLHCAGYNPGKIDGEYGDNTAKAVLDLQKDRKITQDAIAGKNTFEKLLA
ncbi:N-acetylmuramoyl-L-alanine amidase [Robertmurraya kyonggiensis]|uniref:MurNAc-LAA domain-containing protein n=1 Tax=Robertmurraya kyonggiensis TaxID=1037680 RepID=A0A4U1D063_9BACI|nr:N-acetylmuramoyl-L-alanine amidase [Robertmurraya kyonggiensis]TKC15669.1 hypothetical protein FA727_16210 [Robertmurraya kyonggiensis]